MLLPAPAEHEGEDDEPTSNGGDDEEDSAISDVVVIVVATAAAVVIVAAESAGPTAIAVDEPKGDANNGALTAAVVDGTAFFLISFS